MMCAGLGREAIAAKLGTAPKTVDHQRQSVYQKLGIRGGDLGVKLVRMAIQRGWVERARERVGSRVQSPGRSWQDEPPGPANL